MLIAHKIALDPNNEQATYFAKASGTARFADNWALAEWRREHTEGGKPSDGRASTTPSRTNTQPTLTSPKYAPKVLMSFACLA